MWIYEFRNEYLSQWIFTRVDFRKKFGDIGYRDQS